MKILQVAFLLLLNVSTLLNIIPWENITSEAIGKERTKPRLIIDSSVYRGCVLVCAIMGCCPYG